MAFSYDLSTTVGKLRLLIPDSNNAAYNFEDDELTALYALEANNLKRACALALETIAANEAMVQKVIKTLDVQTDGAKLSDALLKRAKLLRDQADNDEAADNAGFDVAEMVLTPFQYRERRIDDSLRSGV